MSAADTGDCEATNLPRVQVLLAVKNGARWLDQLLDSVFSQRAVRVDVLALDDGSDDKSPDILKAWACREPLRLLEGSHHGLPAAYFHLLAQADPDRDAWAFADQDDVWLRWKLSAATHALPAERGSPALWVSRILVAGDMAAPETGVVAPSRVPRPSLANALVETIAPACTMVWNAGLMHLLSESPPAEGARMHDAWVYLVAAAFGTVVVEPRPSLLYRTHPGQSVGIQRGLVARVSRRLAERENDVNSMEVQAREFKRRYGAHCDPAARELVDVMAASGIRGRGQRVRAAATRRLRRHSRGDQLLLVLRFALL